MKLGAATAREAMVAIAVSQNGALIKEEPTISAALCFSTTNRPILSYSTHDHRVSLLF